MDNRVAQILQRFRFLPQSLGRSLSTVSFQVETAMYVQQMEQQLVELSPPRPKEGPKGGPKTSLL